MKRIGAEPRVISRRYTTVKAQNFISRIRQRFHCETPRYAPARARRKAARASPDAALTFENLSYIHFFRSGIPRRRDLGKILHPAAFETGASGSEFLTSSFMASSWVD
jgi:hypothetical protein